MKKKLIIIIAIIIIAVIFIMCFVKKDYKILNLGNNMSNKSADEIKNYILNINSFNAEVSVKITSNKTTNEYVFSQKYENGKCEQCLLEPSNISGLKIIYDGNNMHVENTKLNLSQLYENYNYITSNALWLNSFIEDYKSSDDTSVSEENDTIILQVNTKNKNKYSMVKKLYIDKKTAKPVKMEVQDVTQKLIVYILYNRIEINNLQV